MSTWPSIRRRVRDLFIWRSMPASVSGFLHGKKNRSPAARVLLERSVCRTPPRTMCAWKRGSRPDRRRSRVMHIPAGRHLHPAQHALGRLGRVKWRGMMRQADSQLSRRGPGSLKPPSIPEGAAIRQEADRKLPSAAAARSAPGARSRGRGGSTRRMLLLRAAQGEGGGWGFEMGFFSRHLAREKAWMRLSR